MSIFYFTEFDTSTKLPIRSKYNFNFTKYAIDRNLNTNDKNAIFDAFEKENGIDYSKPTKTLSSLTKYFTPMTSSIINYINKYGYTIHTNYMSYVYINTYVPFNQLVASQFELLEYDDTQIRFIQDYFYTNTNSTSNIKYYTKYNFDFDSYSQDFNVWGNKLVIFTDFMIRAIYLSNSIVGAYGYGLPDNLKKYFLFVNNLEDYLIKYSITSDLSFEYKYPNNIDYVSYGEMNTDLLTKDITTLKDHYIHYGQFELRTFKYNTKSPTNYDILQSSIGNVVSIDSSKIGTGFLYNYVGDNKRYFITCYHMIKDVNVINIIRASFSSKNSNDMLDEGINTTADFRVVGYDRFSDVLVALYDPTLEYNINQNNATLINMLPSLLFDNLYDLKIDEEVKYIGNMGFDDNSSLLSGKIIDNNYNGSFHTTIIGTAASLLIQSLTANGFSGSPICVGNMANNDGNIKCVGMLNSSISNDRYTQAISSKIGINIISNIILIYNNFITLYRNDIVSLNYIQRFGLPTKWLGTYGVYYNSAKSIFKSPELKSMLYTGGYVIEDFIVGFNTIKNKFITNPYELGKRNNIRLNTPLLNSKIYRQFVESSNRPIVIKSITFFENLYSCFNKFNLGKYGNQVGLNTLSYGLNPISTSLNPDTSYFFPFYFKYQNVKFEYYYYDGTKYVLDTETIISDDTFYNTNIDGLGNKFYQSRWEFPYNLLSYLNEYWDSNDDLCYDKLSYFCENNSIKKKTPPDRGGGGGDGGGGDGGGGLYR
jgi:S1-C subfamily serine protease